MTRADDTRPIPRQGGEIEVPSGIIRSTEMLTPEDLDELRERFRAAMREPARILPPEVIHDRDPFPWRVVLPRVAVMVAIALLVWIAGQGEPQPVRIPPPAVQPTVTVTMTADTTIDVHGPVDTSTITPTR